MRRQQLALMMAIATLGLVAAPAVAPYEVRDRKALPKPQPRDPDAPPPPDPKRVRVLGADMGPAPAPHRGDGSDWAPAGGNTRESVRRMRQQMRADAKAGRS